MSRINMSHTYDITVHVPGLCEKPKKKQCWCLGRYLRKRQNYGASAGCRIICSGHLTLKLFVYILQMLLKFGIFPGHLPGHQELFFFGFSAHTWDMYFIFTCASHTYVEWFNRMFQIATERGRCTWPHDHMHCLSSLLSSSPIALAPALFPSKISPCNTLFVFIICEIAIFFFSSSFPLGKHAVLVLNVPCSASFIGAWVLLNFWEKYKLVECLQCIRYYVLTDFFSLQGDIWKVVCCKDLKITEISTHKSA